MGSKKKKKSNSPDCEKPETSMESLSPQDLTNVKHLQLIPIEASESISEFVKEFREIFMPKFKQMEEENKNLKKETQALKIQLHHALEKIEVLENKDKSKNLIIKNLPQRDGNIEN